jgi:hypothetical protein
MDISRADAQSVFGWLLTESQRLAHNEYTRRYHEHKRAEDEWLAASEEERDHPDGPTKPGHPPHPPEKGSEIEHWTLFRVLVSRTEGADVAALESAAHEHVDTADKRRQTANTSAFWSRDVDGQATNRHALRKRDGAIQSWDPSVAHTADWRVTLKRDGVGDDQEEGVASRVLQGTVLNSTATVQEQLKEALDTHLEKVTSLFSAWDENGDGRVSRREFRRAVTLFGLKATRADIDSLFESFDPDGSGSIEVRDGGRGWPRGRVLAAPAASPCAVPRTCCAVAHPIMSPPFASAHVARHRGLTPRHCARSRVRAVPRAAPTDHTARREAGPRECLHGRGV